MSDATRIPGGRLAPLLPPLAAAALCLAAAAAPDPAAAQEPAFCHYDNPAPFKAWIEAAQRGGAAQEMPGCAEQISAHDHPEELILPLPCGHAMHFRRVEVPVADALSHNPVLMGDSGSVESEPQRRASSAPRTERLAGPFRTAQEGEPTSFYYIGKYELTEAQHLLLKSGLLDQDPLQVLDPSSALCAPHVAKVRADFMPLTMPPAVRMSWFDAVEFSRAWTRWLLKLDKLLIADQSRPLLPWREGSPGFVRLPTDAEWEYAARGGAAGMAPGAQARKVYQVKGPAEGEQVTPTLEEIAVLDAGADGGALVGGVGRRLPNLIGAHDMIGNAAEYVQDLFRPTRPDGLYGQAGAAILRGGSSLTPRAAVGLGYRAEASLFTTEGEVRPRFAGARYALSAPFFVGGSSKEAPFTEGQANDALYASVSDALAKLAGAGAKDAESTRRLSEVMVKLAAEGAGEGPAAEALREARAVLAAAQADQEQARREAVTDLAVSTAAMWTGVYRTAKAVEVALRNVETRVGRVAQFGNKKQKADFKSLLPAVLKQAAEREDEILAQFNVYVQMVERLARAPKKEADAALKEADQRIRALGSPKLLEALARIRTEIEEVRVTNAVSSGMRTRWLARIDEKRDERDAHLKSIVAKMKAL